MNTTKNITKSLASKIRTIRKTHKISQQKLSEIAGVSLSSVKRFEQTGEISLVSFTKITIALNIESELQNLFQTINIK